MFYPQSKSTSESSIVTRIQKNYNSMMKPVSCITLTLFVNFNDFEPQYSCKLYSFKHEVNAEKRLSYAAQHRRQILIG